MKKRYERTKEEKDAERKVCQLKSLRKLVAEDFWSATRAALIMIGVDPFEVQNSEEQGWSFKCLPGRSKSYWSNPDGDHLHPNFDDNFDPEYANAKKVAFSKGRDAIDTPAHWIGHFQYWKIEIPWLDVALGDADCLPYLSKSVDENLPQRALERDRAKRRDGALKTNVQRTSRKVKEIIRQHFLDWRNGKESCANREEFEIVMQKYWHPDAVEWVSKLKPGEIPKVKEEKDVLKIIAELIDEFGLPEHLATLASR
jgi:hypothetical protein